MGLLDFLAQGSNVTSNAALIHIECRPHTPLQLMTLRALTTIWVKRKSVVRKRRSLPQPRVTSCPTLFVTSRQMSVTALIMLLLGAVFLNEWTSKDPQSLLRRIPWFKV